MNFPLLGGKSQILGPTVGLPSKVNVYHWNGTKTKGTPTYIRNNAARHVFSLNTCSRCHAGPAQIEFNHAGTQLVVTEKMTNRILTYSVHANGLTDPFVVHHSVRFPRTKQQHVG